MSEMQYPAAVLDADGTASDQHSHEARGPSRLISKRLACLLALCAGASVAVPAVSPILVNLPAGSLFPATQPGSAVAGSHPSQISVRGDVTTGDAGAMSVAPAVVAGSVIAYGDRLKITFLESAAVPVGDGGGNNATAIIFPRMDLSGEYTVDGAGSLSIPKLGQFAAAGKTSTALQEELAVSFKHAIGRSSDVHVAFAERLPVYVVGAVRAAGSIKYLPGMFAMQALASVGGTDRGVSDTSRIIEDIRETARLQSGESRLDLLLIKEARLVAEQANAGRLRVPQSIALRLSQSGTSLALKSLVDAAQTYLEATRKNHHDQKLLAERQVEVVKLEISAQKQRVASATDFLNKKLVKLRELQLLARRGSIPQPRVTEMEAEIAGLRARREDYRVNLVQAERRLIEQEAAYTKLQYDHSTRVESELSDTRQAIQNLRYDLASARAVVDTLENNGITGSRVGARPRLTITRRVAGTSVTLPATETTPLLPGDVLKAEFGSSTGAPLVASGTAPKS